MLFKLPLRRKGWYLMSEQTFNEIQANPIDKSEFDLLLVGLNASIQKTEMGILIRCSKSVSVPIDYPMPKPVQNVIY